MPERLSTLEAVPFHEIHACFLEAFADYYQDTSAISEQALRERAIKNGFDPLLSAGVRRSGRLAAFTLIGAGNWRDEAAAFDIATGVVPDERGKGCASRMFSLVEQQLRHRGIRRCVLEVLEQNEPAINAYLKAGFTETRRFDCFKRDPGEIRGAQKSLPLRVQKLERPHAHDLSRHWDFRPSFENSLEAIERIGKETMNLGVFEGARCIGELTYYPTLSWVLSLTVHREYRRTGIATELLDALATAAAGSTIKVTNVDRASREMGACLRRAGFEIFAGQLEMECRLT